MSETIKWEEKGVSLHFFGELNLSDVTRCNDEMYEDPRLDNAKYQLWDFSDVESVNMDADQAKKPAVIDKGASVSIPNLKVALVAMDAQLVELCNQYIETSTKMHSSWEFYLCDKVEDAKKWISP